MIDNNHHHLSSSSSSSRRAMNDIATLHSTNFGLYFAQLYFAKPWMIIIIDHQQQQQKGEE
jgi:hypothetical protein